MKKTLRSLLASLLAVLMVVCSMPFTVFAAQNNREWWVDDGVDPSTITEEPYYVGFNDDNQALGSWAFEFGKAINYTSTEAQEQGYEDHRDDYKPIIAVTVSSQGDSSITSSTYSSYYKTFYGASTTYTYDKVKADGNMLNPAELKAGQRIAVTVEFGGFDLLNCGTLKGYFDTEYLQPAYYNGQPFSGRNGKDTWTTVTGADDETATIIGDGGTITGSTYSTAMAFMGSRVNPESGLWEGSIVGKNFANGDNETSNFIGTGLNNQYGTRDFGKYGIVSFVYSFEVLKDCDLSKIWTFMENDDGTIMEVIMRKGVQFLDGNADSNEGLYLITINDTRKTFAKFAPTIWSEYKVAEEPTPATQYTITVKDYAGNTVLEKAYDEGTTGATVLADLPANTTADVDANGHNTYSWPEIADVTAAATYTEQKDTTAHKFTVESTPWTEPTCVDDGVYTYKCSIEGCTETSTSYPTATGKHTFTNYVSNGDAKCGADGTKTAVCDVCKVAEDTIADDGSALQHSFTNYVYNDDAKCGVDGTETATCDNGCGETDTRTATGTALQHSYTNYVYNNDAKCGVDGTETATCDNGCGETDTRTATGTALQHSYTNYVYNNDATCTADGTETATCDNGCGETDTRTATGTALQHSFTNYVYNDDATCAADGTKTAVCDLCGVAEDTVTAEGTATGNHDYQPVPDTAVEPTYDAPGKEADQKCSVCGDIITGAEIAKLGVEITVLPSDLANAVSVNGEAVTDAAVTVKVDLNSDVVLAAEAIEGATFVGWNVNGKLVTTEANATVKALANATYEPVFQLATDTQFTVVFTDQFGNAIDVQTVASGADVVIPDAPVIPGYTFTGWSKTDAEIAALTAAATITPVYEQAGDVYTITAEGATVATPYSSAANVNTARYNTLVTVSADDATAWKVGDKFVSYSKTYSFYVGSDIVLTKVTDTVNATPTVAAVSVSTVGDTGKVKASFLATREMAGDNTYVNAGFVYALNPESDAITLNQVDGTNVRAAYCGTDSDQFALVIGRISQTGTIVARAFLAYVDNATGETEVIYAAPQEYTYPTN